MPTYHYVQRKSSLRHPCNNYVLPNSYYVTILTRHREHSLGKIVDHKMVLSDMGRIVSEQWFKIPEYFPDVELDEFVVMPNHIHGIIIKNHVKNHSNTQKDLSLILRLYKAGCTRIINAMQNEYFFGWHKNYHDHIIRNEKALHEIRNYIRCNPLKWDEDEFSQR